MTDALASKNVELLPLIQRFGARYLLSARELLAVSCAVRGLPEKQAADELGCSRATIATYWQRIYRKVGIRGQRAVVAVLLEELLSGQPRSITSGRAWTSLRVSSAPPNERAEVGGERGHAEPAESGGMPAAESLLGLELRRG